MLENSELFELKSKFGHLYSIEYRGISVIFRELTFEEYDKILYHKSLDEVSSADIEDLVLSYAVVYPENFDIYKLPPGVVSSLAQNILDISGFFSVKFAKKVLEEKRQEANEVKNLMKAFIIGSMPAYRPEELDALTFSDLASKVALAEKIIEIRQGSQGLEPNNLKLELIDPDEEEQKAKDMAMKHDKAKPEGAAPLNDPIAQKLWGGG